MDRPKGRYTQLPENVKTVIQDAGLKPDEAQEVFTRLGKVVQDAARFHPHRLLHILYDQKGFLPNPRIAREMLACPSCAAYFLRDTGLKFREKLRELVLSVEALRDILERWKGGENPVSIQRKYAEVLHMFSQHKRVMFDEETQRVLYAQAAAAGEVMETRFHLEVRKSDGSKEHLFVRWDPFSLQVEVTKENSPGER